jgi:hypothetical protein
MEKIRQGGVLLPGLQEGRIFFIFSKTSINTLRLTQTLIPWIVGFFSGGKFAGT